jgi:hydrogenase expression/formation protein HypC
MCLGIPGKVVEKKGSVAKVDFGGLIRDVNVSLVNVRVGDFVIVHAGFAISKVNKREALKTIKLVKEIVSGNV